MAKPNFQDGWLMLMINAVRKNSNVLQGFISGIERVLRYFADVAY